MRADETFWEHKARTRGVVAFDFDGVLGDTVFETYIMALKAHEETGGKVKHSPTVEKQFREARPLITKVEHFLTVLKLIGENPRVNFKHITQQQMNARFKLEEKNQESFLKSFYAHRKQMQKPETLPKWLALNKSFPKVAEFIKRVRRYNDIYIATTKNRESVVQLLSYYHIDLPQERIISVEFSKDKREQLREISRRSKKPLSRIVLVEDAIEQVKAAKEVGAKALLYRRGYSTQAQKKEARKLGVPIIDFTKKFDSRRVKSLTRV